MKWWLSFAAFLASFAMSAEIIEVYTCHNADKTVVTRLYRTPTALENVFSVDGPGISFRATKELTRITAISSQSSSLILEAAAIADESDTAQFAQVVFNDVGIAKPKDANDVQTKEVAARLIVGDADTIESYDLKCILIVAEQPQRLRKRS